MIFQFVVGMVFSVHPSAFNWLVIDFATEVSHISTNAHPASREIQGITFFDEIVKISSTHFIHLNKSITLLNNAVLSKLVIFVS
jgi:hypothetical protein